MGRRTKERSQALPIVDYRSARRLEVSHVAVFELERSLSGFDVDYFAKLLKRSSLILSSQLRI